MATLYQDKNGVPLMVFKNPAPFSFLPLMQCSVSKGGHL